MFLPLEDEDAAIISKFFFRSYLVNLTSCFKSFCKKIDYLSFF